MAQVSLPDGSIIPDFPDNPSPADIQRLQHVAQQMEARAAASTVPGALKEVGKVLGTSVHEGISGLPRMVNQGLESVTDRMVSYLPLLEAQDSPSAEERRLHMQKMRVELDSRNPFTKLGKALKPETELGQRTANVGSSVVGSMLYGGLAGASPGINVTTGLLGGLGAEALGKMSNPTGPVEQDDPAVKLAGGLVGGVGGGLAHEIGRGVLSSQAARQRIAKILSEGLSERDVAVVGRRMQQAANEGVPLIAPQAFSKSTNIDKLTELASRAPLKQTRKILNNQVDAVAQKVTHEVGQLPGSVVQPVELANRSRDKATKFFDTFKQQRAEVAERFLPSLDVLDQKALRKVNKELTDYLRANPNKPLASEAVKMAKQVMRNPAWQQELKRRSAAIAAAHETGTAVPQFGPMPPKYISNPENLYGALDEALAQAGAGKNAVLTNQSQKLFNRHAAEIRNIFKRNLRGEMDPKTGGFPLSQHPELDAQKAAMKPLFEAEERALQGLVGRLANTNNRELGATRQQSLAALFKNADYAPRGVKPGQGEFSKLQRQLAQAPGSQDTALFQDAVKSWLREAVSTSARGTDARNNPEFMSQLIKKLGNPTGPGADPRWLQTKDILLANARDMGLSPQEAQDTVLGFEKVLRLAARTSQRQGTPGVNAGTILQEASPAALRRIGGVNIATPIRQPALWMQRVHEKRVLSTIDKWLTDPQGMKMMRDLAHAKTYKQMRGVLNSIAQQFGDVVESQSEDTSSKVQ